MLEPEEIRGVVLRVLGTIAPEADLAAVDPHADLRDQLDLDSMDVLNFALAVHEALGVDIPEADYGKLVTLDTCVAYLAARGATA